MWGRAAARSVWFNFVGRDFFNALAEKDEPLFKLMLVKYLVSFVAALCLCGQITYR
jgi:hypothetical protein